MYPTIHAELHGKRLTEPVFPTVASSCCVCFLKDLRLVVFFCPVKSCDKSFFFQFLVSDFQVLCFTCVAGLESNFYRHHLDLRACWKVLEEVKSVASRACLKQFGNYPPYPPHRHESTRELAVFYRPPANYINTHLHIYTHIIYNYTILYTCMYTYTHVYKSTDDRGCSKERNIMPSYFDVDLHLDLFRNWWERTEVTLPESVRCL